MSTSAARRAVVLAGLSSLASWGLGGCAGSGGGTALAPPVPEVAVGLREYGFDHVAAIEPGRTIFRVVNRGSLDHEMVVARLPDDFAGSLVGGVRIDRRLVLDTLATLTRRGPGSTGLFALDLRPGRYAFVCFVADPDGVGHHRKGMTSELVVGGSGPGPGSASRPSP